MTGKPETIVLGGGCFWCIEAVYKRIDGVGAVRPGYAGGHLDEPTYKQVCTGMSGHAEVVKISFDPSIVALEEILRIFWKAHDPTTPNRQGHDVGSQYRSVILYTGEEQRRAAERSVAELARSGAFAHPPVTQIQPLETFWPAEDHHRDYFDTNRNAGYCRAVIEPKLRKLALLEG